MHVSTGDTVPDGGMTLHSRGRWTSGRIAFLLSLLAIAVGVALGHTAITWLNATLL